MRSRAAVSRRVGDPWTIAEIDLDPPGPGEVLVEWAASGLCHSDENLRNGARVPAAAEPLIFPMVGGHEGAGVVAATGPGVGAFAVGDHVLANFVPTCGRCRYCVTGRGHLCDDNAAFMTKGQVSDGTVRHRLDGEPVFMMGKLGTFSERSVVSERSLLPVPAGLDLEAVCLVSCGVSTGWGSMVERGGARPGDVVVVVGTGGLGTSAVQGARMVGAAHIVGIDPIEHRRETAQKFGATQVFASMAEARDAVLTLTNGQGADVVVLTPSIVTGGLIHEALDLTGKGATCVVTGMGEIGVTDVPMDIGAFSLWNKELKGCLFGSLDPRSAAPRLMELYRQGVLDLDAMVTRYPLADIGTALADAHAGRVVRAVVTTGSAG